MAGRSGACRSGSTSPRTDRSVDYGTLTTKTVLTAADGRASAFYTAPSPPANSSASKSADDQRPRGHPDRDQLRERRLPRSGGASALVPTGVGLRPGQARIRDRRRLATDSGVAACRSSSTPRCRAALSGVASYDWDFGDGTTGTGIAMQHTYAGGGTFPVRLTGTENKGQTAWVTQQVPMAAGPTAMFTGTPPDVRGLGHRSMGRRRGRCRRPPFRPTSGDSRGRSRFQSAGPCSPHLPTARDVSVTLTVTDGNGPAGRRSQTSRCMSRTSWLKIREFKSFDAGVQRTRRR